MDNDDKRRLDYRPDIEYQEDYLSKYDGNIFSDYTPDDDDDDEEDLYDQGYMDHIQETINDLIQLIPNLTPEFQTAVNQVFKPIFNDWYENLKKKKYPKEVPDPDKPIITLPDPDNPNPVPPEFPGLNIPSSEDPEYIIGQPPLYDPKVPIIYTPEPDDPIIGLPPLTIPIDPYIGEYDDIFIPSSPWNVTYETIDPVEIIELEFVKNLAELYNYYTESLKKTLGRYYLTLFQASISSSSDSESKGSTEELRNYFLDRVSDTDARANEDPNLKHLVDAAVRNEITGRNKLNFFTNMFSVESTLYHLKNFKAAYELRLRYEKEEMSKVETSVDSMSNRMLSGLRESHNKKYDNAYINLYKYLNSSVSVLDDVMNTHATNIKAKETLYKKGGTTK